jgi:hypothetical protein
MRVRFASDALPEEARLRRRLRERVDGFWHGVASALSMHLGAPRDDRLAAELEPAIERLARQLHDGLEVEVDAPEAPGLRLSVRPAEPHLDPLATEVVDRAPSLTGLLVVRNRDEMGALPAVAEVRRRSGVDLAGARVRMGFGRGHLLEVVVYSSRFGSSVDDRALDAANLLVPRLLGDAIFDDWVGSIDVAPLPRGGSLRVVNDAATRAADTLSLEEVRDAALAAIRGVTAELPEAPCHAFCERAEWVLFEMQPAPRDDYPGTSDLALFTTMVPEAAKTLLDGSRFSSCRFSRHGERFVYVKIDAADLDPRERLERRIRVEEMLDVTLVPGRMGAVVGAGLGLRYVVLLVALANLEDGIRLVRRALERCEIGPRAWILFCDSVWQNEWVGLRDDGPTPPA